ncbi:MAG: hypothetical protein ACLTZI_05495 [[Eubacterium] siraeum]
MQKSLIAVIADRYRQQDFDALTSKDDLKPADIRRICFDLGIALYHICAVSEGNICCDGVFAQGLCERRA